MGLFKRLGSIILALCMALTVFVTVSAEEETQVIEYVDMTREEAVILKALNIISDGQYEKNTGVTRSAFANAIVMTVNDTVPQAQVEYDLGIDDGGIYWLISKDVMHGNGAGEFRPKDTITVAEAVKISLSLLGYGEYAEAAGGYPLGYMTIANRNNLLDGVLGGANDVLSYDNFINLLYNVTECDVMDLVAISEEDYREYEVNEGETLLSIYRNIYKDEGIVEADEVSGLYNESENAERGKIRINGTELKATSIYAVASDWLGMNVRYYYSDENGYNKNLICAVPRDNKTLEINSKDIISYNSGVYTYQADGMRTKNIELKGNMLILYNGAHMEDCQNFVPQTGKITLIDNNADGNYDVLKIIERKIVIAERVSQTGDDYFLFDKYNGNYNQIISDYNNSVYRVYDSNGQEKKLEQIADGNVLEIEVTSASEPSYKITVVSNVVSDMITSIDSEKKYLKLASGETIETTTRFRELITDEDIEIVYNTACMIYMTSDKKATYIDYSSGAVTPLTYRVAYLHNFVREENAFNVVPKARILDESGAWQTYGFAKKVTMNEGSVKAENIDISPNIGGLCRYMLNVKGEISEIYFPTDLPDNPTAVEMDDKLQVIYSGSGRYRYYPGGYAIGSQERIVRVADTMKVFIKPTEESNSGLDEDDIKVTSYDILRDGTTYQFEVYNFGSNPGVGDVAMVKSGNVQKILDNRQNRPIVVNEVGETITEDGERLYAVWGLKDGSAVTVNIDDQRSNGGKLPFKTGDVIYLVPDINGMVTLRDDVDSETSKGYSYGILCGYDENGILKAHSTTSGDLIQGTWGIYFGDNNTSHADRTLLGKAYDVTDTHIYVASGENANDWSKVEPFKTATGQVYVYDEVNETFRTGNAAEAICAKYDVANASDVYVVATNKYQIIVIYP